MIRTLPRAPREGFSGGPAQSVRRELAESRRLASLVAESIRRGDSPARLADRVVRAIDSAIRLLP